MMFGATIIVFDDPNLLKELQVFLEHSHLDRRLLVFFFFYWQYLLFPQNVVYHELEAIPLHQALGA